jgi:hypothetical protein
VRSLSRPARAPRWRARERPLRYGKAQRASPQTKRAAGARNPNERSGICSSPTTSRSS